MLYLLSLVYCIKLLNKTSFFLYNYKSKYKNNNNCVFLFKDLYLKSIEFLKPFPFLVLRIDKESLEFCKNTYVIG